jgi:hypothetical protein
MLHYELFNCTKLVHIYKYSAYGDNVQSEEYNSYKSGINSEEI